MYVLVVAISGGDVVATSVVAKSAPSMQSRAADSVAVSGPIDEWWNCEPKPLIMHSSRFPSSQPTRRVHTFLVLPSFTYLTLSCCLMTTFLIWILIYLTLYK